MVGRGVTGFDRVAAVKADRYQEARAWCAERGERLVVIEEEVVPARAGALGSVELRFRGE